MEHLNNLISQRLNEVHAAYAPEPRPQIQVNARLDDVVVAMLDQVGRELELSRSATAGLLLQGAILDAIDQLNLEIVIDRLPSEDEE